MAVVNAYSPIDLSREGDITGLRFDDYSAIKDTGTDVVWRYTLSGNHVMDIGVSGSFFSTYSGGVYGTINSIRANLPDGSPIVTIVGLSSNFYSISSFAQSLTNSSMLSGSDTINGSAYSDKLYSRGGNDIIMGGEGDDIIEAGSGDDRLSGGNGNDWLIGSSGNDSADGGSGVDTFQVSGNRSSYKLATNGSYFTLTGQDGADTLGSVERIRFSDGTLVINPGDPAFSVYRLYEAALNRVPDGPGLTAWTAANTNGMGMQEMARQFMAAPEFVQRFGTPNNDGFIDLLYRNVLDRPADPSGASGWLHALNSGQMSRENVLLAFADSSENVVHVNGTVGAGIWLL